MPFKLLRVLSLHLKVRTIMTAVRLNGTEIAKQIRAEIKQGIAEIAAMDTKFKPALAIVQVGDRQDSSAYVRQKRLAAEEVRSFSET